MTGYGPKKGDRGKPFNFSYNTQMLINTLSQVVVAMSGGVDSSVTARLLADKVAEGKRLHLSSK